MRARQRFELQQIALAQIDCTERGVRDLAQILKCLFEFLDGNIDHLGHGLETLRQEAAFIQMKGNEVFRKAVGTLGSIAKETLEGNNIKQEDIAWLVPHQANLRIITAAAKKLGLPMERVIVTVDEHANTSSASIPLALDVAVRDGRVRRGDLILLEAFGGGFTWGSALIRF